MMKRDSGITLIEVIMAIVLLGILVPAVYTVIMSIDRGIQRSYNQEQVYQIALRAVEQVKIEGTAAIDQESLDLPAGYVVSVYQDPSADDSVSGLALYRINVVHQGANVFTYTFYWTAAP
jgi:prepilin-type N-terminal cleavage/methylation domain-containing protein